MKVMVLGAGGAAGINFCRCLALAGGYRVLVTDCDSRRLQLPDAEFRVLMGKNDVGLTDAMVVEVAREWGADVVYAQADGEVRRLSRIRNRLCASVLLPSAGVIAMDKPEQMRALGAAGVPIPRWFEMNETALARDTFEGEVGLHGKLWLRATNGAGSKAALPVSRWQLAVEWMRYWRESRNLPDSVGFMASEYLPGREYAWQGVYRGGRLLASVTRERLEYMFAEQMPSGQSSTPSVARIVHNGEVGRIAEAAVSAVDDAPNGVYGVDLKESSSGVPCVTEINVGRFYTTSQFYAAAGFNMPDRFCRWAVSDTILEHPIRDPILPGLVWVRGMDMEGVLLKECACG